MNDTKVSAGHGGGFLTILTVLFIGLKLTGCIDWSWWWVLSPIWIAAVILILVIAIVMVIVMAKR